jgi:hypothetical protein
LKCRTAGILFVALLSMTSLGFGASLDKAKALRQNGLLPDAKKGTGSVPLVVDVAVHFG